MEPGRNTLDKFGHFLVKNLRDKAIQHLEFVIEGRWKAPAIQKLQNDMKRFNEEEIDIIKRAFINSLDAGVHDLLFAIQESNDNSSGIIVMCDDENIAELSDGLHGEIFSKNGWYAKFSNYGEIPE